jgi:steroid delta-isomerase-like uncharacterized protein
MGQMPHPFASQHAQDCCVAGKRPGERKDRAVTSTTSIRDIVREHIEVFNRHDGVGFAAGYAEDAVVWDPMYPEPLRGRQAVEQDIREYLAAFPDMTSTIETVVIDGDVYAVELSERGTHTGALEGPEGTIAPTGRTVSFRMSAFGRIDGDGRVIDERRYYDLAGLLEQIGAA